MIVLIRHPKFQSFMMLFAAGRSLEESLSGEPLWALLMMICSCIWMFGVWGNLRAHKSKEGQS